MGRSSPARGPEPRRHGWTSRRAAPLRAQHLRSSTLRAGARSTAQGRCAIATVAVKDLGKAARFYEETLGLGRGAAEGDEAIAFESGDTTINVYRSNFAGTNKATAVTWASTMSTTSSGRSKSKGVAFQRYDMPDTRHEGDVHVSGDIRVAWFKDPDGNILSVVNR